MSARRVIRVHSGVPEIQNHHALRAQGGTSEWPASLGYSRMYHDDLAQLDAEMSLHDAMFRWCRGATEETHS